MLLKAELKRCVGSEHVEDILLLASQNVGGPGDGRRRQLVLAACACAEKVLPLIRDEWLRGATTSVVQTAQAWAHGEATITDLTADVRVLRPDAGSGGVAAACLAASAAYGYARAASEAAGYAANAFAADAADRALREMAVIVRSYYPRRRTP